MEKTALDERAWFDDDRKWIVRPCGTIQNMGDDYIPKDPMTEDPRSNELFYLVGTIV